MAERSNLRPNKAGEVVGRQPGIAVQTAAAGPLFRARSRRWYRPAVAALLGEARIVIDQATLGPGFPAQARNDGVLSELVTVRNYDNENVTRWQWVLLKPRGSTAVMSAPTAASSQFEPDVDGTYLVLLFVNEGRAALQKARSILAVKSTGGMRFPGQGESNEANWTSVYTGLANETGWWEDLTDILRANQAVFNGTILTVNTEPNLGASRRIVEGAGIVFTDGGALGDFEVAIAPGYSGVEGLEDVVGQPENLRSTRLNNPATRNAGKSGQVSLGSGATTSGDYSAALAGRNCSATGSYSIVVGGNTNQCSGSNSFVGGGVTNAAGGAFASIIGGESNSAGGDYATVAGGVSNSASVDQGTVGGGNTNLASALAATVAGGDHNTASGSRSAVLGGLTNVASGVTSCVGGGTLNTASNTSATVGGGTSNTASSPHTTISGGQSNTASAAHGTVAGGQTNAVSGAHGTIAGGQGNTVNVAHGAVGGGTGNTAGSVATIAGGNANAASAAYSSVGGGSTNAASGAAATVGGGLSNTSSGDYSAIPGGRSNIASNDDTVAIGRAAQATHSGSHVQKDGNAAAVASSAANQLTQSFTGGIRQFFIGGVHRRSAYSSTTNFEDTYHGQATTAGATAVNLDIIGIPTGQTVVCRGHIIGKKSSNSDAIRRIYEGSFINVGGVITTMTALTDSVISNAGGNLYTATVAVNSTNIRITYAGVAATTVYWTWSFTFWVGGGA
mgnify:CR=1 FL=1